jgi:hypothetical protein
LNRTEIDRFTEKIKNTIKLIDGINKQL